MVFCADAYQAIRSDRPYRRGRSAAQALDEVRHNAGTQFDPQVVEALDDAAGRLRSSALERVQALSGGIRSRRAALLLVVLALGGSAVAATPGGPLRSLFGGGEGHTAAGPAACALASACRPLDLGPLGEPFPASARAARADQTKQAGGRPHASAPGNRGSAPASGPQGSSGSGRPIGAGEPHPGRRGGAPGNLGPQRAARARGHRPASPGRSEEAPGRPLNPGKPPTTGAPGRSEVAPGKPDSPPGLFGEGQTAH